MSQKILREINWILPRFFLQGISFNETGNSGFGDRLRGISLAIFLARFHRTNRIFYHEAPSSHFPYRMVDLIQIEGIELIPHSAPFPPRTLIVQHRCGYGSSLKSMGFRHLWRLKPKNPAFIDRIESLGIGANHIGLHIRGTDALHKRFPGGEELQDRLLSAKLEQVRHKYPNQKIFLASDSRQGVRKWQEIATNMGFTVDFNDSAEWNETAHRQSSEADMLVDFFSLSRCSKIIRLVPSEFSRFAAGIKTGKYTKYHKSDKI